jgi:hypothetical protein
MTQKAYVCIATAQNTINALPLYETQCNLDDISQVKILQSSKAKEEGWSCHLNKFVKQKRGDTFSIDYLNLQLSTIEEAREFYKTTFMSHESIVINIGGGTKAMTLNTILAINNLEKKLRIKYTLIYPNIESGKFDIYTFAAGLEVNHIPMKVHMPLEDILTCYGEKDALSIVEKAKIKPFNNAFEKDTRNYFYSVYGAYTDIFDSIEDEKLRDQIKFDLERVYGIFFTKQRNALMKSWNSDPAKTKIYERNIDDYFKKNLLLDDLKIRVNGSYAMDVEGKILEVSQQAFEKEFGYDKGIFFEIIAQNRVTEHITNNHGTKKNQIVYNLKPMFETKSDKDTELDIVINAYNGELLVFEVKSKIMEKKDFDAMRLKLQKYAGIYNQSYVLIPFYWEDFSPTVSLNRLKDLSNKYLQYLISLPFEFDKNNIKFCVLGSKKDEKPFTLYRQKEYITRNDNDSKINKSEPFHELQIVSYKTIIDQYINKNK